MFRFALFSAVGLCLVSFFGCGDEEEDTRNEANSPTITARVSETPARSTPTATAIATDPTASPPTPNVSYTTVVPADWPILSDPVTNVSLRYPPAWFVWQLPSLRADATNGVVAIIANFPQNTEGGSGGIPSTAVKIDVLWDGPLYADCETMPVEAEPASLGGVFAWTTAGLTEDEGARYKHISAFHQSSCYSVTGYFGHENTDEDDFDLLVESFRFLD